MQPLLSIVIANYNYGRFLEEAIRSVLSQIGEGPDQVSSDEVELIVIDGNSTDNSVEVIRRHADKLAYWVSEPDKGQSDAFNKGFAKARGKYLTWLNADDILAPGCLDAVFSEMRKHPDCEWFTGNFFRFVHDTGKVYDVAYGPNWYPKILQWRNSPMVSFGPSTFFSRKIYEMAGKIDERLHFIMDNDLWLSFQDLGICKRRINCMCWGFRLHEASKTGEYGDHVLSPEALGRCKDEEAILWEKHHYRRSKIIWCLICLVRLLDGSFLKRAVLRARFIGKDVKWMLEHM